ncbi:MAG: hypothetical protein C0467_29595 [Planctomycetaceae bacterium]|nr:hypothetical protein [Planctomycetaceae bacterium]
MGKWSGATSASGWSGGRRTTRTWSSVSSQATAWFWWPQPAILPMCVIRRLDAVLEPTRQAVLDTKKMLDNAGITEQRTALCAALSLNILPMTLSKAVERLITCCAGHPTMAQRELRSTPSMPFQVP